MPQKWMKSIKLMLLPALFLLTLAGCGSPSVGDTYPLESVSSKDQGQTSRVYRAENKSVPVVAKELADQNTPDEISKEDSQHMFLIYPNEVYHLQQDAAKPSDTLIEIDTKEYVRNNYDSSFLQGYILASVLDDLFDGHKKSYKGSYRGYSSKDIYKPSGTYHVPTAEEKKQLHQSRLLAKEASSSGEAPRKIQIPRLGLTEISSRSKSSRRKAVQVKLFETPAALHRAPAAPSHLSALLSFLPRRAIHPRVRKRVDLDGSRNGDRNREDTLQASESLTCLFVEYIIC